MAAEIVDDTQASGLGIYLWRLAILSRDSTCSRKIFDRPESYHVGAGERTGIDNELEELL